VGATPLETPVCEDEPIEVGLRSIGEADGADWYCFDATNGVQWSFAFGTADFGVSADLKAQIFETPTNTVALAERTMAPSDSAVLALVIPRAGRYWLKVSRAVALTNRLGYRLSYQYGTPPATVAFATTQVTVSEGLSMAIVTVNITGAAVDAEVRVSYETRPGSATANQDYTPVAGELVWSAGAKSAKTIMIPLVADVVPVWEGSETFGVKLYAVKNCSIGQELSACLVVIAEQSARLPGKFGFLDDEIRVLPEGSNELFRVSRTNGFDGVVTARVDVVEGSVRTNIAQLVWAHGDASAKTFQFGWPREAGFQRDRGAQLRLTALGGATVVSSARGLVTLTRRDDLVERMFAAYAADPLQRIFAWRTVSGFWFDGRCASGETESWLRSAPVSNTVSAAMSATLRGPGILMFDWRTAGNGVVATCKVALQTVETRNGSGETNGVAVAVANGSRTVEWGVKASGPDPVFGAIRSVAWYPLAPVSVPVPVDKSVVVDRDFAWMWSDVIATTPLPQGTACFYEFYAASPGRALTRLAQLDVPGYPRAGDVADRAVFMNLLAQSKSGSISWRVDVVAVDAAGRRAVFTGPLWRTMIIPDGVPEFVASEGGFAPDSAGCAALPELTIGLPCSVGPFAVAHAEGGAMTTSLLSGTLPAGVRAVLRDSALWFDGVPARVGEGSALIRVMVRRVVGASVVTTGGTTVRVDWRVRSLGLAAGSFDGYRIEVVTDEMLHGGSGLTVTAAGAVSGKVWLDGQVYTWSFPSFAALTNGQYVVSGLARGGAATVPVAIAVDENGKAAKVVVAGQVDQPYQLLRNAWGTADGRALITRYAGYYTLALPVRSAGVADAPTGTGFLTVAIRSDGSVYYTGQLADGKTLSGSTVLLYGPDCCSLADVATFYVQTKPLDYAAKAGLFGVVRVTEGENISLPSDNTLDPVFESGMDWINTNPKSIFGYNSVVGGPGGFTNHLDMVGGFYDKTINLQTYYQDAVLRSLPTFQFAADYAGVQGTSGFTLFSAPDPLRLPAMASTAATLAFPRRVVVMDGAVADDAASINLWNMGVSFTRTTGLFSGRFTVYYVNDARTQQKTRTFSSKGVFLPVRSGRDKYPADWMGFYLHPDSYKMIHPVSGAPIVYLFNWSMPFALAPESAFDL